jgi:3-hydroxy-5-methyl-1-naphthoate 3-O-methyltransferase
VAADHPSASADDRCELFGGREVHGASVRATTVVASGTGARSPRTLKAMDDLELARLRIYALQDGAIRAQALVFCLRNGLFDRLEHEPLTLEDVAGVCGLSRRVLPALFSFLAANGLVRRGDDGRFANTAAASAFLVRESPHYVGGRGLLFGGFYDAIAHLPESLATGQPWTPEGQHDMFAGFGPDEQRWFADGMFANSVHGGLQLVEAVDFSRFRRLLDVGGNAGGYSIAILRLHEHLSATIFDLEGLRELAVERAAEAGLMERIRFAAGSFFEDELPRGHDALLLSSILHDWGDDDSRRILGRCFRALEPGGTIIVTEPMLAEDATGPDHPAASGLTMALLGGENRTRSRVCELLAEAGFKDFGVGELGLQNSVVSGQKPA